MQPQGILYVRIDDMPNPLDVAASLSAAYREISTFMASHAIERASRMRLPRATPIANDYNARPFLTLHRRRIAPKAQRNPQRTRLLAALASPRGQFPAIHLRNYLLVTVPIS